MHRSECIKAAGGVLAAGALLFWPEERPDVIAEEALALWDAHQR